ncbi:hypothetical protein Tco_1454318, partial [Tanacetum coccineum]
CLELRKCNMRLKTYIKPKEATFQVLLDAFALTPFHCAFLITTDVPAIYMQEFWATVFFCPKIPGKKFEDLPLKHDILSFSDVNVDYLHQPWRAFPTVINKCLSGKETGMDKILLHEDTQVYGTIISKELTNQAMLESNAYKTYYLLLERKLQNQSTRLKSKAKVAKPDKKKQPAKKTKAKGLAIILEVVLTKPEQLKLATKRSKKDFHMSHEGCSGDRVDTQSKVPDEQQQKSSGTDEGTDEDEDDEKDSDHISDEDNDGNNENDGDDDDANDDDKQEGNDTNDDDEDTNSDRTESDIIKIPILDQSTIKFYEEEEENIDDEETMYDDEDDEVMVRGLVYTYIATLIQILTECP